MNERERKAVKIIEQFKEEFLHEFGMLDGTFNGSISIKLNIQSGGVSGESEIQKKRKKLEVI